MPGTRPTVQLHLSNLSLGGDPAVADLGSLVAERIGARAVHVEVIRTSLDARARPPVWRGTLRVTVLEQDAPRALGAPGVRAWSDRDEVRRSGVVPAVARSWDRRPIVVGAGPAGIFCALRLAEAGAPAILIERGGPVEERVPKVNGFWRGGPLDEECNILYGEGGAGTFSDGKIYTRRRDGELGWVFRRLVDAGADPGILQESWAHLGTDKVRAILPELRRQLRAAGVEVRFNTRVDEFLVEQGVCTGVRVTGPGGVEEVRGGPVVVATGHSARDTVAALLRCGALAEQRPIAIGARIEHPQGVIDAARYPTGRGDLPPASYRLAYTPENGAAAYTFCMCPGGMVVPAQESAGLVVVNGMSFAARRAMWANSALIVQVPVEAYAPWARFPGDPMAGIGFQKAIERAAFEVSGGYSAPAQRVPDFLAGRASESLPRVSFPMGVVSVDLARVLPAPVVLGMREAIRRFDAELPGFAGEEGVLIAPETRTTAPLRFLRGEDLQSTSVRGLYPCGEGAGFAGGIISAALDGFRVAQAVSACV